jgi:Xaa-Pro aminopeptidase
MRKTKDGGEIENIKKAQSITDAAFAHILKTMSAEMTETDVAVELEYFMKKNGADGIAFDIIAVSGKNSSRPHGQPENAKLQKGFLPLDFGAKHGGYCSDMTRTVCIGEPTKKMLEVYNTVKSAQLSAIEAIKAGAEGIEVDRAARKVIKGAGYEKYFGHGLGHSLGLEIHEPPSFPNSNEEGAKKESAALSENMVMTVEPGIYLEDEFGVRIEDLVVVKRGGCQNLTESGKELIVL